MVLLWIRFILCPEPEQMRYAAVSFLVNAAWLRRSGSGLS
jgi:hypothetical protein